MNEERTWLFHRQIISFVGARVGADSGELGIRDGGILREKVESILRFLAVKYIARYCETREILLLSNGN